MANIMIRQGEKGLTFYLPKRDLEAHRPHTAHGGSHGAARGH